MEDWVLQGSSGPDGRAWRSKCYGDLYAATRKHLRALFDRALSGLKSLGIDRGETLYQIDNKKIGVFIGKLLELVALVRREGARVQRYLEFRGVASADYARTLLQQILGGLAVEEQFEPFILESLLRLSLDQISDWRRQACSEPLVSNLIRLRWNACKLYGWLEDRLGELEKEYQGTPDDPERGLAQAMNLLSAYPDIADSVYAEAGLRGITGVPPRAPWGATPSIISREAIFIVEAGLWTEAEAVKARFCAAGLMAINVLAAILSGGSVLALGAFILASSAMSVGTAESRAKDERYGYLTGAGSAERAAAARDGVTAARWASAINVVTLGMLMKMGGPAPGQFLTWGIKSTGVSALSGGLTAFVNPSVRNSDHPVGLILMGAAEGAVGFWVAVGVAHGISAGASLVGKAVTVATSRGGKALDGTITAVEGSRVTVRTEQGSMTVNVAETRQVGAAVETTSQQGATGQLVVRGGPAGAAAGARTSSSGRVLPKNLKPGTSMVIDRIPAREEVAGLARRSGQAFPLTAEEVAELNQVFTPGNVSGVRLENGQFHQFERGKTYLRLDMTAQRLAAERGRAMRTCWVDSRAILKTASGEVVATDQLSSTRFRPGSDSRFMKEVRVPELFREGEELAREIAIVQRDFAPAGRAARADNAPAGPTVEVFCGTPTHTGDLKLGPYDRLVYHSHPNWGKFASGTDQNLLADTNAQASAAGAPRWKTSTVVQLEGENGWRSFRFGEGRYSNGEKIQR